MLQTGLTKFTRFEMLYVILLNIHKKYRSKDVHHILQDQREKNNNYIHSLALTLTFSHLANEPLQPTIMLFSLMYLTCDSATENKYLIGAQQIINGY